jgi:hypothetical protein
LIQAEEDVRSLKGTFTCIYLYLSVTMCIEETYWRVQTFTRASHRVHRCNRPGINVPSSLGSLGHNSTESESRESSASSIWFIFTYGDVLEHFSRSIALSSWKYGADFEFIPGDLDLHSLFGTVGDWAYAVH